MMKVLEDKKAYFACEVKLNILIEVLETIQNPLLKRHKEIFSNLIKTRIKVASLLFKVVYK